MNIEKSIRSILINTNFAKMLCDYTEWITRSFINKAKEGGYVRIDLIFSLLCFVDRCLSFCPFSFGHCVVGPSSIYGF
jgi:hypothetical protein